MPVDDRCDGENLQTYQDVLAEIVAICNTVNPQFVVVAGDFNTDMSRKSLFVDELKHFCNTENFAICSRLSDSTVSYTFESMANRSRSLIDHVLISDNLRKCVTSHFTIDDVDNASDHLAVVTEFSIACEDFAHVGAKFVPKTAWYKAGITETTLYKSELDRLLENVCIPTECVNCRDLHCNSHGEDIQKLYSDIVHACLSAGRVIPKTGRMSVKPVVPGWSQYCDSERKVAMYWHNVWKSEGRPREGFFADARRRSRLRYHKTVRAVRKQENVIRCERMASSITANRSRDFWKEVRAMRGIGRKFPSSVDGASGDEVIANHFAGKFCNIFNSVGYDHSAMDNVLSTCNDLMSNVDQDGVDSSLITVSDVEAAVKSLKKGKADGNVGLFSDHIICGTTKLLKAMSTLINCMIVHGICPSEMLIGTIIPIPKNKRLSVNNSDNFRGICLQSVICKIIDLVMLRKQGHLLQTSDLQFGFKTGVSASSAAAVVHETLDYYVNKKGCVYVLALDATKAFDRVEFSKLFQILLDRHISPLYVRLLHSMYISQQLKVNFNGASSSLFEVSNGVKQGGVLSPTLFSCYIDGVIKRLEDAKNGCFVGDCYTGCVAYADDLVLLAPSLQALRQQIKIVENFATEHNIKFNGSKSQLLYVSSAPCKVDISVKVAQQIVPVVDKINYLGHEITCCRHDPLVDSVKSDFLGKFNAVLSDFACLESYLKQTLVEKYCYSFYGSYFCDLKRIQLLSTLWRKTIRRTWQLPPRAHGNMLPFIADCVPIDVTLYKRYYKFFENGLHSQNIVVSFIFENARRSRSRLGNNYRYLRQMLKTGASDFVLSWLDSCAVNDVRTGSIVRDIIGTRDSGADCLTKSQCDDIIHALCVVS